MLHGWFALIGISVLTTWQHHFVDVPTGALLGFACLWLWPEAAPSPLAAASWTTDPRRRRLAALYAGPAVLCAALAAWGGTALWLFWPAVALLLVSGNYALFGAAGFQKASDGRISPAALWLLAPYRLGARANARIWARRDTPAAAVMDGGCDRPAAPPAPRIARSSICAPNCPAPPAPGTTGRSRCSISSRRSPARCAARPRQ